MAEIDWWFPSQWEAWRKSIQGGEDMSKKEMNAEVNQMDAGSIVEALMPWLTTEAAALPKLVADLSKMPHSTLGALAMGARFIVGRRATIVREAAEEGIIISDQSKPNLGR